MMSIAELFQEEVNMKQRFDRLSTVITFLQIYIINTLASLWLAKRLNINKIQSNCFY